MGNYPNIFRLVNDFDSDVCPRSIPHIQITWFKPGLSMFNIVSPCFIPTKPLNLWIQTPCAYDVFLMFSNLFPMVFPRFPIIFPPRRNKNTSDLRPLLVSAGALRSKGQAQSEDEAMRSGDDGDMDLEICYNNVIHIIYISNYTYRHNIYIYICIHIYISIYT